jgi:hypothetical protein
VADILEGRREHYLELSVRVRAIAREARFPAARRALIEIANRFEEAGTPDDIFRLRDRRHRRPPGANQWARAGRR